MGKKKKDQENQVIRVKTPRDNQVICKVIERHRGKRMSVECTDGNRRMCRVPGKKRRGRAKKMWRMIKSGSYVLVEPWSIESDDKGDVVWKYSNRAVNWLRKRGYLKDLE
ncbi:MAG: translation initiation factor IF-1A [Thermoplasmatota archaeon]